VGSRVEPVPERHPSGGWGPSGLVMAGMVSGSAWMPDFAGMTGGGNAAGALPLMVEGRERAGVSRPRPDARPLAGGGAIPIVRAHHAASLSGWAWSQAMLRLSLAPTRSIG
jgi:hypothetical protein